jgi:3-mercaptopyruvate sulfurtransferase SseA
MSAAGIGPERVVAYDDQAGAMARAYLLRAYGHDAVAVLDGGLPSGPRRTSLETPRSFRPGGVRGAATRGWNRQGGDGARGPRSLVLDARAAGVTAANRNRSIRAGGVPGRSAPYREILPTIPCRSSVLRRVAFEV